MKASLIVGVVLLCALAGCSLINAPDDVKLASGANLGGSGDGGQSASTSSGLGTTSSTSTGAGGAGGTSSATSSTASGSGGGAPTDPYRDAVMADGPVAYWRFGEASGKTAKDEVGNAHPGTYVGTFPGGLELGAAGIVPGNDAVKLDGRYGCVDVGEYFQFGGRVSFSVEAWVNITAYSVPSSFGSKQGSMIVSTEGSPLEEREGWSLSASDYGDGGYPVFDAWSSEVVSGQYIMGAYSDFGSGSPLTFNEWHYIVGVYTDTSEEIWIDGSIRSKLNQTDEPLPIHGSLTLGCKYNGDEDVLMGLVGRLDEVAIYDKALTKDQIKTHHIVGRASADR